MKDPRIDAYIAKSLPFAQPILRHLRELIHRANPAVQETIKWGMPFFDYKGPFCNFAAFKKHAVFGFWKYKLIKDPEGYLQEISNKGGESMGNMGRILDIKELPPDKVILDFLKQAKKLNDEGVKLPAKPKKVKVELEMPTDLMKELSKNKKAREAWEKFSYSHQKEYIEWLEEAKTQVTREKRRLITIEWLEEGKNRNWKYQK